MNLQLTTFERKTVDLEVILLPEGISYWHLRRYCSPYNEQWVRVIHEDDIYKLLVVQVAHGEIKVISKNLHYKVDCSFMNANLYFTEKSLEHVNEGLLEVLFSGKEGHSTGCVDVNKISKSDFNHAVKTVLEIT